MATIKLGSNFALDMRSFNYDIDDLPVLTGASYSSTFIRGTFSNGVKVSIEGTDFTYNSKGLPTGGFVRKFFETQGGVDLISVTGIKISVASIFKAASTPTTADDIALFKAALGGNDSLQGSNKADVLTGLDGNDKLYGRLGNDKLYGGNGDDLLYGSTGHDYLTGGGGKDTFVFRSRYDSEADSAKRDTIYDFSSQDKIDLAGVDANHLLSGNQAFTYIGKSVFHGVAGELRFQKQASDTYIYGDVNGDKKADFAIHLDDAIDIQKAFFIL
ncbi:calcium-binding protein [Pararhizobium sp. O133]|uniref:calcium-binding protein n=1 Tax=Pararhizobium sp. O133 TaxID=3449278 RepID=UPI003F6841F0